MKENTVIYRAGEIECKGHLIYDEKITTPRPAVMVAHAWYGQDDFARNKARELADLGYIGFAIDLFGKGKNASSDEEAGTLIKPLYEDRKLLQKRIIAAFDTINRQPGIEITNVGAIGFCFGGMAVIELIRSGTPIQSAVSFHGILGTKGAQTTSIAKNVKGSLLVLHGYDDPLVSTQDIVNFQKEFNEAGIDWQMNIYSHTSHAFTNPKAHDKAKGLIYNEKTSNRAWLAMKSFFKETLI